MKNVAIVLVAVIAATLLLAAPARAQVWVSIVLPEDGSYVETGTVPVTGWYQCMGSPVGDAPISPDTVVSLLRVVDAPSVIGT